MKIISVKTIRPSIFPNLIYLHITTDEGIIGLGETDDDRIDLSGHDRGSAQHPASQLHPHSHGISQPRQGD